MKKINGWLYAFWIALIVILIMALAVGLIAWAGSGAEESEGSGTVEEEPSDDDGGSEIIGGNTLTIEAEDATLFNSMSSSASSTTLIGTEETTLSDDTVITDVKNFNTAGDKIVFQVLASAAIENVTIDVTACCAMLALFSEQTFADNDKILTVNGGDPIILSGTLTNPSGSFAYNNYGTLTGTISLNAGINYIEITAASTNTSGYLNVDKIDLSWDGEATIEAVNDYTGEVFDVDATGVATMEAEDAALMNAVAVSGSTYLLGTETDSNDESVTHVNNFNAKGDMIVYQVLAAAAIDNVSLDLYARLGGTHSAAYDSDNFISVNGEAVSHTGSVASSSYGNPVTATISLQKGINYIVIEMEETGSTLFGMNMGLMNVDRIDLNGGTGTEPATEVSSADELVEALEEGGNIVLTTDITVGTTAGETDTAALTVSADTTIDLAGNTLSTGTLSSDLNTIEVSKDATLTIKDSAGTGSIKNTYNTSGTNTSTDNAAAIAVAEGGTLVVESGTITSTSVGVRAEGVTSESEGRATVTIDGGTIESTYFSVFASGDVDVTINGGTISGTNKGICIGGDSNFGYSSYQYNTVTTLTISGGEISCTNDSAICTLGVGSADSAEITISGGTISNSASVTGSGTSITAPPAVYVPSGTLTITGGTIISTLTAVEIRGGTATISGGTLVTTYSGESKDDATQETFGAKTYGYALSVYAYGVNSSINSRLNNSSDDYTNDVNVTVTGGTFVGSIYVAAEAEYSVSGNAKWQVKLNDSTATTTDKYVVTMTGIEFVGYKSDGYVATETDTVAYYLYAVDSKLAAIDSTNDANDLIYSGTDQDAKSVEGYGYEIVISTDASDGSVVYTLVGEASTMDSALASWFGNGAADGDAYVTVKLYVGVENTLTYTSAGGETKTIDSSDLTSGGYYIFAYRLTGTLGDGTTAVSPSSAKEYTVKDASGETLYTVTIDYTQITITEAV